MKRNLKRLTLHRETVRHLSMQEMSAAQGGASSPFCQVTDVTCPRTVVTHTCFVNCHSDSCPTECDQRYCQGV